MTDPGGIDERRALERRAFGRDGSGLSAAEAARLAELRRMDAAAIVEAGEGTSPVPDPAGAGGEQLAPDPRAASGEPLAPDPAATDAGSPVPDPADVTRPRSARARLPAAFVAWLATGRWKRPRYLIGAIAVLLLAGVAVGAAIPRPPDVGVALRPGEQSRLDAVLEDQAYDPGSVALLERSEEALLWTGTKSNGAVYCAMLDLPDLRPVTDCAGSEELRSRPLNVATPVSVTGRAGMQGEQQVQYNGSVLFSARGYPAGSLQKYTFSDSRLSLGMTPEEQDAVERIRTEQKLDAVWIAGRWRGLTIWHGQASNGRQCLVVDDGSAAERASLRCADQVVSFDGSASMEGPLLAIELPEGEARPAARIELWTPAYSGPSLVIVEGIDPTSWPFPTAGT